MLLYDLQTITAELKTDEPTILRWVKDGILPAPIIVDGLARWPSAAISSWAGKGCPPCDPPTRTMFRKTRLAIAREDFDREVQRLIEAGIDLDADLGVDDEADMKVVTDAT